MLHQHALRDVLVRTSTVPPLGITPEQSATKLALGPLLGRLRGASVTCVTFVITGVGLTQAFVPGLFSKLCTDDSQQHNCPPGEVCLLAADGVWGVCGAPYLLLLCSTALYV